MRKYVLLGSALIIISVVLLIISVLFGAVIPRSKTWNGFVQSSLFQECDIITMECELTAYCPGPCCNTSHRIINGRLVAEDWSDKVAAGPFSITGLHKASIDLVAVDPTVIPFGSLIRIKERLFVALDSGSAIKGRKIDVSVHSHDDAKRFGRKRGTVTVYIPKNPRMVVQEIEKFVK